MPNRILKESIATSDNLNSCSPEAQMLFIRLITRADDYGRFEARPSIVRGFCYPLALDRISDEDIVGWLSELQNNRLLQIYQGEDEVSYLYLVNWERHQRVRNKRSRYPQPPALCEDSRRIAADCGESQRNAPARAESNPDPNPIQSESNQVIGGVGEAPDGATPDDLNPLEEEILNLQSWGRLTEDDRQWIVQFTGDYPKTTVIDIRDCRDYWMAKTKPHNAKVWKSRLRNWMKHKDTFGGNGATNRQGARGLPTKYTPAPINTRPLLKPQL